MTRLTASQTRENNYDYQTQLKDYNEKIKNLKVGNQVMITLRGIVIENEDCIRGDISSDITVYVYPMHDIVMLDEFDEFEIRKIKEETKNE